VMAVLTPGLPNDCLSSANLADAAMVVDAPGPGSDSGSSVSDAKRGSDAGVDGGNSQSPLPDSGELPIDKADAATLTQAGGLSQWWEPDIPGVWTDSGSSLDASTVRPSDNTVEVNGPPSISQPGCSLTGSKRTVNLNLRVFGSIGTLLVLFRRNNRPSKSRFRYVLSVEPVLPGTSSAARSPVQGRDQGRS